MSGILAIKSEMAPLRACTVSHDVEDFDLLIEDMESELGESWGELHFDEAKSFIEHGTEPGLEFIAIAVSAEDAGRIPQIKAIIQAATAVGIKTILIAENLGPNELHSLMRAGCDDFVPYPLPEDALSEAIARISTPTPQEMIEEAPPATVATGHSENLGARILKGGNDGQEPVVFAIHGLTGGAGSTSMAVNLAWEMANIEIKGAASPSVCLIDLDLQFGSVSTYLDLSRKQLIVELLADITQMDSQAFEQALTRYKDKLNVFTSPPDILPLDIVSPEDIDALISLAKESFDVVIIDMPTAVTQWTETVLEKSDIYFALMEMDIRSAQNMLRFIRTLKDEGLPYEKVAYVLNKVAKSSDLGSKGRVKKLADSLGVEFRTTLSQAGTNLSEANDNALPMAEAYPKSQFRNEVRELADTLWAAAIGLDTEDSQETKPKARSLFGFGR